MFSLAVHLVVHHGPESVSSIRRNRCPACAGIGVHHAAEYAAAGEYDVILGARVPDLDFSGGGEFFASLIVVGLFEGFAGACKSSKKGNLHRSALDVGKAFSETMKQKPPWKQAYFTGAAEVVLTTADVLRSKYGIKERSLYQAVLDAPWDELEMPDDMREKVEDLKAQAQGMLLL